MSKIQEGRSGILRINGEVVQLSNWNVRFKMTEQEWLESTDPQRMMAVVTGQSDKVVVEHDWIGRERTVSDRKLRLFACACCRQAWHLLMDEAPCYPCSGTGEVHIRQMGDEKAIGRWSCTHCGGTGRVNRSRRAVEVAERYAEGMATIEELAFAHRNCPLGNNVREGGFAEELAHKCAGAISELVANSGLPRWFSVSNKLAAAQADLLRHVVGNPFRPMRSPHAHPEVRASRAGMICREYDNAPWLTQNIVNLAHALYDGEPSAAALLHDAMLDAGQGDERPCELCRPGFPYTRTNCPLCHGTGRVPGLAAHFAPRRTCECTCHEYPMEHEVNDCLPCHGTGWLGYESHPKGCWALDLMLGKE